jgi:hypothetical protein
MLLLELPNPASREPLRLVNCVCLRFDELFGVHILVYSWLVRSDLYFLNFNDPSYVNTCKSAENARSHDSQSISDTSPVYRQTGS